MARLTKTPWFRQRRMGWGLSPVTWQGWAITAVFVAIAAVGGAIARGLAPLVVLLAIAAFIIVAVLTGEKPGHRDG